jgi:hypothetical protein
MSRPPSLDWLPTKTEVGTVSLAPARSKRGVEVQSLEIDTFTQWRIEVPHGEGYRRYATFGDKASLDRYLETQPVPQGWRIVERTITDTLHFT